MIWFKSPKDNDKTIQLLKKLRRDFDFDQTGVKYRLLSSIDLADQKLPRHFRLSRVAWYSVSFAGVVLMVSATATFASGSRPGDALFSVNKFGEQIILNLPLSVEQKAQVQAHIVTNRLEALDEVSVRAQNEPEKSSESRQLKTIQESDETLVKAVNQITENKHRLEAQGKTEAAQKLENVLDRLQEMAEKRTPALVELEENTQDTKTKEKIRLHREKIQAAKQKAQAEIKRYRQLQLEKQKQLELLKQQQLQKRQNQTEETEEVKEIENY